MVFVFILPVFFILARLIVALTNCCCCCKGKKNKNGNDFRDINKKVPYDIFNPLVQSEKIGKLFNDCSPTLLNKDQKNELIK